MEPRVVLVTRPTGYDGLLARHGTHGQAKWFLEKQGLVKLAPEGEAFDPNHHEAVAHDPGDGESVVSEVLRPGYVWKGRVLRPAMVRVRG